MPTRSLLKITCWAKVGLATYLRIFSSSSDLNSRTFTRFLTFSIVLPKTWKEKETCQARVEQDSSQSLQRFETERTEKSKSDLPHYSSTCRNLFRNRWWQFCAVPCSSLCMVASKLTGWTAKPCGLLLSSSQTTNKAVSCGSGGHICSYPSGLEPAFRIRRTCLTLQLTFVDMGTSWCWWLSFSQGPADSRCGLCAVQMDSPNQPPGWNLDLHPLTLIKQLQWFHSTGQPVGTAGGAESNFPHRKHSKNHLPTWQQCKREPDLPTGSLPLALVHSLPKHINCWRLSIAGRRSVGQGCSSASADCWLEHGGDWPLRCLLSVLSRQRGICLVQWEVRERHWWAWGGHPRSSQVKCSSGQGPAYMWRERSV